MIVCSCNVFSEADVRRSVTNAPVPPRDAQDVYRLLGCAPQCGKCAPTIERILRDIYEPGRKGLGTQTPSQFFIREGQAA